MFRKFFSVGVWLFLFIFCPSGAVFAADVDANVTTQGGGAYFGGGGAILSSQYNGESATAMGGHGDGFRR